MNTPTEVIQYALEHGFTVEMVPEMDRSMVVVTFRMEEKCAHTLIPMISSYARGCYPNEATTYALREKLLSLEAHLAVCKRGETK